MNKKLLLLILVLISTLISVLYYWNESNLGLGYFWQDKDGFYGQVMIPKNTDFGTIKLTKNDYYTDIYCFYLNKKYSNEYSLNYINLELLNQDQAKNPQSNLMYFYCGTKKVSLEVACKFLNSKSRLIKTDKYNCYNYSNIN